MLLRSTAVLSMNHRSIKVDIVTIAKEIDAALFKTLANVSSQSYEQIEQIVIYSQATDTELERLKNFAHHKKLSVYSQAAKGIASAFNNGIEQSSGQLLLFLNSGDSLVSTDVIERVASSYREQQWLWATGETISLSRRKYLKRHVKHPAVWDDALFWYGNPICHQSTFYSCDLIDRIGLYREDLSMGMDYEYNVRANQITAPALLHFPIAYYDTTGVSSIKVFQQFHIHRRIRKRYFQLPKSQRFKVDAYCFCKSLYRLAMIPAKLWL